MKLKEFAGDEITFEGHDHFPRPSIYVSDELDYVVLDWIEPLEWHATTWANLMNAIGLGANYDYDVSANVSNVISQVFAEDTPGLDGIRVDDASDALGDEGYGALLFCKELPLSALEMDDDSEELYSLCWDFLAACENLTDPGTFGHVYLFAEVARRLGVEWTDEVREAGGVRGVLI